MSVCGAEQRWIDSSRRAKLVCIYIFAVGDFFREEGTGVGGLSGRVLHTSSVLKTLRLGVVLLELGP